MKKHTVTLPCLFFKPHVVSNLTLGLFIHVLQQPLDIVRTYTHKVKEPL